MNLDTWLDELRITCKTNACVISSFSFSVLQERRLQLWPSGASRWRPACTYKHLLHQSVLYLLRRNKERDAARHQRAARRSRASRRPAWPPPSPCPLLTRISTEDPQGSHRRLTGRRDGLRARSSSSCRSERMKRKMRRRKRWLGNGPGRGRGVGEGRTASAWWGRLWTAGSQWQRLTWRGGCGTERRAARSTAMPFTIYGWWRTATTLPTQAAMTQTAMTKKCWKSFRNSERSKWSGSLSARLSAWLHRKTSSPMLTKLGGRLERGPARILIH